MSSELHFFAIHALDGRAAQDDLNTNEQLAAMARQGPASTAALRAIDGVDEARAGARRVFSRGDRERRGRAGVMKRLAISLEQLAERSNLVLATWKAARGKQQRPPVARFLGDLDARLDRLAASILCGQAPQGQYTSFIVHDAKRRFANAYLDAADRWLLEHARVRAHVRYMDDILWWCDSRAEAKATLDELSDFLWRERRLQLKPSAPIAPSRSGVAWCGTPVNSAACLQGKKCCLARAARWLLEQQRQERPLSEPQRQRARQRQPEQRFPLCPELDRRGVWQPPGMDLPLPMDQVLFPVAVALWSPSELKGSWGAGSEGAAASSRQLPGSPPAACSR